MVRSWAAEGGVLLGAGGVGPRGTRNVCVVGVLRSGFMRKFVGVTGSNCLRK